MSPSIECTVIRVPFLRPGWELWAVEDYVYPPVKVEGVNPQLPETWPELAQSDPLFAAAVAGMGPAKPLTDMSLIITEVEGVLHYCVDYAPMFEPGIPEISGNALGFIDENNVMNMVGPAFAKGFLQSARGIQGADRVQTLLGKFQAEIVTKFKDFNPVYHLSYTPFDTTSVIDGDRYIEGTSEMFYLVQSNWFRKAHILRNVVRNIKNIKPPAGNIEDTYVNYCKALLYSWTKHPDKHAATTAELNSLGFALFPLEPISQYPLDPSSAWAVGVSLEDLLRDFAGNGWRSSILSAIYDNFKEDGLIRMSPSEICASVQ